MLKRLSKPSDNRLPIVQSSFLLRQLVDDYIEEFKHAYNSTLLPYFNHDQQLDDALRQFHKKMETMDACISLKYPPFHLLDLTNEAKDAFLHLHRCIEDSCFDDIRTVEEHSTANDRPEPRLLNSFKLRSECKLGSLYEDIILQFDRLLSTISELKKVEPSIPTKNVHAPGSIKSKRQAIVSKIMKKCSPAQVSPYKQK